MKKLLGLVVLVSFVSAQTRPAFAQSTPPDDGWTNAQQGEPAQGPPQNGQIVRVNFKSKSKATVYDRATGRMVCNTPCSADVPSGTTLRTVLEGGEDEPHDFVVTGQNGPEVDVEIKRGGTGALVGGIVMTSIGGLLILTGLAMLLTSAIIEDADSRTLDETDLAKIYRIAGIVSLVAGVGVGVGGFVVLGNRSNEAATKQRPAGSPDRDRDRRKEDTKAQLHEADLAASKARDPLAPPPAAMPFRWSVAF